MKAKCILGLAVFMTSCSEPKEEQDPCLNIPGCKVYEKNYVKYPVVYDRDIDSLAQNFTLENLKDKRSDRKSKLGGEKVVVIYVDNEGTYSFDASVQKYLPDNCKPTSYSETDFIVLRKSSKSLVGTYNNHSNTRAYSIGNTLYFINPKSKEIEKVIDIDGGSPPDRITYRRSAPESTSSAPTVENIVQAVVDNLNF